LIQPTTARHCTAILLSLLHLNQLDPEASVAFLPSDHHYRDEVGFLDGVRRAFEATEWRRQRAILLGASPTHPEVGYGWIEPGPLSETAGIFRVMRFLEKPSLAGLKFANLGWLWNTFVMVRRVRTFLAMIRTGIPQLYDSFPAP